MKCARNIVSIAVLISAVAVGFSGCGSTASLVPLDDAYYYPEKKKVATDASDATTQEEKPVQPVLEYINVQDTTITVRIKR